MLFSPKYATFYKEDLHPDALPEDVIQVTAAEHIRAVGRAPSETLVVTDGKLYVVPPPPA